MQESADLHEGAGHPLAQISAVQAVPCPSELQAVAAFGAQRPGVEVHREMVAGLARAQALEDGEHLLEAVLEGLAHGRAVRSEEGRVGKESRSSWSPYH